MIAEAKRLLESVIKKTAPELTVVKSAAEEARQIMARKFPFAALITNPGNFDSNAARTVRYFEGEGAGRKYIERYIRGVRSVPVLIRVWAEGEDHADDLLSRVIPELPAQWEYGGFTGRVEINTEEHSDHAGSMSKPYCSVVEVTFSGTAARAPREVPVIEKVENSGGEFAAKSV